MKQIIIVPHQMPAYALRDGFDCRSVEYRKICNDSHFVYTITSKKNAKQYLGGTLFGTAHQWQKVAALIKEYWVL